MSHRASDVLVLGAGPTGLVATALLARAGHRVTALDPGPAAEGPVLLTRPGQEVMEELGLGGELGGAPGARRHAVLELRGPHETVTLGDGLVDILALPRGLLLARLREAAIGFGATFLPQCRAAVPVWDDRRVVGVRARGPEDREAVLTAPVTIDASGSAAFLAASLGHLLPRRGRQRLRVVAAAADADGLVLGLAGDAWVLSGGGWTAAVVRRADGAALDEPADAELAVVLARLPGLPPPGPARTIARDVGARHRAISGEGWVAVGEAAGRSAPGSPGATSSGLLLAASAAWEADLALRRGRPFGTSQAGATVTLARQAGYLEGLLDRALNRAARVGMLTTATGTAARRRALAELLQAEWVRPRGRLRRIAFVWWLDRATRRRERRTGAGPPRGA